MADPAPWETRPEGRPTRILVACLTAATLFGLLAWRLGYPRVFRLWSIPTMSPPFADTRVITHGAISHRQGLDPMVENPADPWKRRLNYPRIWQTLYGLGLAPAHTIPMALTFIGAYLLGFCLLFYRARGSLLFLAMAAVLSPASLLAMERGNSDLLIFFLVVLSLLHLRKRSTLSALLLFVAHVLKLFPIFAAIMFLGLPSPRARRIILLLGTFAWFHCLLTHSDLRAIHEATQRGTTLSFGVDVAWTRVTTTHPLAGRITRVLAYGTVLAVLAGTLLAILRRQNGIAPLPCPREAARIDAFRAGSAIYLGCYLLGSNWDYRLIFLLPTLPLLHDWAGAGASLRRRLARFCLLFVFLALWHLPLADLGRSFPRGDLLTFLLDETAQWGLFLLLPPLLISLHRVKGDGSFRRRAYYSCRRLLDMLRIPSIRSLLACMLVLFLSSSAMADVPSFDVDYPRGMEEARKGNAKEAIRIWRSILKEGKPEASESARIWYGIARLFRRAKDEERAMKAARRALAFAPGNEKLQAFLARQPKEEASSVKSSFAEARERFAQALESDELLPGSAEGTFDELIPVFRKAMADGREKAFSQYALGTCLLGTGKGAKAREQLEAALAAGCGERLLRFRLGLLDLSEGKTKEAVPHLEAAVPCSPYGADAAAALIRALALTNQADDASRIQDLVRQVVKVDAGKLEGVVELIPDPDVRKQAESLMADHRRAAAQESAEEAKADAEAQKVAAEEAAQEKKDEAKTPREKTRQEQSADNYNSIRYREYLQHLARLGRGEPSSWSGPIPEGPKKE